MKQLLIGVIGGSGLGDALAGEQGRSVSVDTPFGPPSSPIKLTHWNGVQVAILQRHGPGHLFNPTQVPYRANIFALKKVGVTHILASGATGSLRQQIQPGHLVVLDQLIDKTHHRPNTFYDHAAVHVEFAHPFCLVMRSWLLNAAKLLPELTVHPTGTYVCMEGPAFSTIAESHLHRAWGADVIGMTTCPEAKLAREAEIPYALVALPTDFDCWRPPDPDRPQQELLAEILQNLHTATDRFIQLLRAALKDIAALTSQPSPASTALKLAIWSDKSKIPPDEISRLSVLWGKYF